MKDEEPKLGIKAWADADRPREKLLLQGRRSLSDAELMAILIGSGNRNETAVDLSKRILYSVQNQLDALGKLQVNDLMKFNGIGEAKAITIIAALELGRRRKESQRVELPKISCSKDAYELLSHVYEDLNHEEFWILLLDRSNRVIKTLQISQGGIAGTVVDPKMIFGKALAFQASGIVLSHNHPSGNRKPSMEDIKITKKLAEAATLLDMQILDHLIFCHQTYYSFKDEDVI